jgi:exopolysaccharide biosynthesis polyprenyl glycosylphosphotransferase
MKRYWALSLLVLDVLAAMLAWFIFYVTRATWLEHKMFIPNSTFYLGISLVPIAYILFYYLQGTYLNVRRLYRLKIIQHTLFASIIGSVLIFFVLLLDDDVLSYRDYYYSFSVLFLSHFFITLIPRLSLVTLMIHRLRQTGNGFSTVIIGGSERALHVFKELDMQQYNVNAFIGYVNVNGSDHALQPEMPYLGHVTSLEEILAEHHVDEVIVAIESSDHDRLHKILVKINDLRIIVKVLPDMYELLSGSLKMTNIYGALFVELNRDVMPLWQQAIKRFMDISLSIIAILVLLPLYLIAAVLVKFSSPGPIFFLQERIGLNNKPFQIIKFRTMYVNSEANGPQLSSSNDARITPIGRFMRKTRLDEFPQFVNVILGHMSLVGPRPERQFYIDQIVQHEPQYVLLNRVRPGITSWGQVKYGYAENVEQMLDRMKYDLLYINNRSIALDLKILFYTVAIVVKAKGK